MKEPVKDLVLNKAKAIKLAAEAMAERTNDWQMIKAFMGNRLGDSFDLTETQKNKLECYQFAYNQRASGKYTDDDVVKQLCKAYDIKKSQAYEDLSDSKELFSFLIGFNKAFEIRVQIDGLNMMMEKCKLNNDAAGYASLAKVKASYMALLPDEAEKNPADDFISHTNIIEFNPALIGAQEVDEKEVLAYINKKRGVKINTELFTEAEIIDEGTKAAL